jgi:hypothetical protein
MSADPLISGEAHRGAPSSTRPEETKARKSTATNMPSTFCRPGVNAVDPRNTAAKIGSSRPFAAPDAVAEPS